MGRVWYGKNALLLTCPLSVKQGSPAEDIFSYVYFPNRTKSTTNCDTTHWQKSVISG